MRHLLTEFKLLVSGDSAWVEKGGYRGKTLSKLFDLSVFTKINLNSKNVIKKDISFSREFLLERLPKEQGRHGAN